MNNYTNDEYSYIEFCTTGFKIGADIISIFGISTYTLLIKKNLCDMISQVIDKCKYECVIKLFNKFSNYFYEYKPDKLEYCILYLIFWFIFMCFIVYETLIDKKPSFLFIVFYLIPHYVMILWILCLFMWSSLKTFNFINNSMKLFIGIMVITGRVLMLLDYLQLTCSHIFYKVVVMIISFIGYLIMCYYPYNKTQNEQISSTKSPNYRIDNENDITSKI